jgi:hypothetical protein
MRDAAVRPAALQRRLDGWYAACEHSVGQARTRVPTDPLGEARRVWFM